MTEMPAGNHEINLSFDAKVVSNDLAQGAEVWLRGSDADEWINLITLDNNISWESFSDISIINALKEHNQAFSTSTQVKFSLASTGMLSIDNILIDFDGAIEVAENTSNITTSVYPTLITNDFSLEIDNENASKAEIAIVNGNGQIVQEMEENLVSGENIFNFNTGQKLAPGMYFVTIKIGSYTEVQKITKVSL